MPISLNADKHSTDRAEPDVRCDINESRQFILVLRVLPIKELPLFGGFHAPAVGRAVQTPDKIQVITESGQEFVSNRAAREDIDLIELKKILTQPSNEFEVP